MVSFGPRSAMMSRSQLEATESDRSNDSFARDDLKILRLIRKTLITAPLEAAGNLSWSVRNLFRSSTAMTLSMEDGYARLLVLKKNRIIAWNSGQIAQPSTEPDMDADGSPVIAGTGAFNPLGPLLEGLTTRTKKVVVDLPLHVPLLRHVQVPDVKRRYFRDIVNTEVLDSVPFTADEVDIKWLIAPGEDSREASVVAVPRDRMDELARTVRDSNLAQTAVYPKASALAAAVARPDVFILHMTKGQTAVVLVRGGVPRIVHRL